MVEKQTSPDTLSDYINQMGELMGGEVFVEDARSDRVVTYEQLRAVAHRWSPPSPEPVALIVEDPLAFAVTFVSLLARGATVVPLDPQAPATENQALMHKAGATTVVADCELPWPDHLALCSDAGPQADVKNALSSSEGAVLLFSSGSTGERKLIRLEQSHLLAAAVAIAAHHELGPGERGYNSLPLHHVNAEVVGVLSTLVAGATLVLDSGFHKTGFWKLMHERSITWINAVPAIIAILAGDDGEHCDTDIRFVRSASAPLPIAVLDRFEARYGLPIIETYGMTEGASQITANPLRGVRKPGSAGLPVGVQIRVLAPTETVGNVQIRGASVVSAYVNGVAADRFDADGWLDSGDQGYLDSDGYLFLVGRTDDVINNGGEKIFPREIEEVLAREPAVDQLVVAPLADAIRGQVPVAFVKSDDSTVVERLKVLSESLLSRAKQPTRVVVVDELPRGATGKVSRPGAARLAAKMFGA